MRYYLDTEFDGFGGPLLSIALVREDGESLYLVLDTEAQTPWVRENVVPILWDIPAPLPGMTYSVTSAEATAHIARFLAGDPFPQFVSDWPDDIRYLCELLITGPGQMVRTAQQIHFTVLRVDAYPTSVPGAVQHNAWWDAVALRQCVIELEQKAAA